MPDYRKLYYEMCHACDDAIELLTKARQHCEELYLSSSDEPIILSFPTSVTDESD